MSNANVKAFISIWQSFEFLPKKGNIFITLIVVGQPLNFSLELCSSLNRCNLHWTRDEQTNPAWTVSRDEKYILVLVLVIINSVMDAEMVELRKLYLNYTDGCVYIFLFVWISWFSPVRVYRDANDATVFCTILVIIHMPGLSMSLDEVVSHNIWCSAWSETYTWTEIKQ